MCSMQIIFQMGSHISNKLNVCTKYEPIVINSLDYFIKCMLYLWNQWHMT